MDAICFQEAVRANICERYVRNRIGRLESAGASVARQVPSTLAAVFVAPLWNAQGGLFAARGRRGQRERLCRACDAMAAQRHVLEIRIAP
jgi:hypothetical protein